MDRYSKYIDLDIDGITSKDVISISVTPACAATASYAQFANPETFDGYVRLRAVSVPTTAITAQYYIVQGGGQTDSGSGTVVEGYTKAQVDNKIAAAIKVAKEEQKLLDHPVGSIYQSMNSTDPSELFGGTWERIKNRFVFAAGDSYEAGATGGEERHMLTVSELPQNIGTFNALSWETNNYRTNGGFSVNQRNVDRTATRASDFGDADYTLSGGGAAHNNMPPYLVAYMWYRTA